MTKTQEKNIAWFLPRPKPKQINKTENHEGFSSYLDCVVMPLDELERRAEKIMNLKKTWDIFYQGNFDSHLKTVIMVAIFDAYNDGQKAQQEA